MTPHSNNSKKTTWGTLACGLVPDRLTTKPRPHGITMIIDRYLGLRATEDLLGLAGNHPDHIKLGFGTSALLDEAVLRRKIELVRDHGIDIYPGGTLGEVALVQDAYPLYVKQVKAFGFSAVEVSDGTIEVSPRARADA